MKIQVNTEAVILLNGQRIRMPIDFEMEVKSSDEKGIRSEINKSLKKVTIEFGDYDYEKVSDIPTSKEENKTTEINPVQKTYYRPVHYMDDGTNIEYGNAPEELGENEAFLTMNMCEEWLNTNGYDQEDFAIIEYHDDDIEDVKFIYDDGEEVPKDFVEWKFSDKPFWFACIRTKGTTSDLVWNDFDTAKKDALKWFKKECVSVEFYKIDLPRYKRADIDDFNHLAALVGLESIGTQTPMVLAMCKHLDKEGDHVATYSEELQYMSRERIVEALKNLNEDSYLLTEEQFDEKWEGSDRESRTDKELEESINDLYAMYTYYGFVDRLDSPYTVDENGQKFEIIRPITVKDCNDNPGFCDVETLPLWEIRLEKGNGNPDDDRIRYCYPEEISIFEIEKRKSQK